MNNIKTQNQLPPVALQPHIAASLISISRVHGSSELYGSELEHQSFIRLTIKAAKETTELGHTIYTRGEEYITVHMSFSQYAELISSHGVGEGVPCTLARYKGQTFKYDKPEVSRLNEIQEQVLDTLEDVMESLKELRKTVEDMKLTNPKKKELSQALDNLSLKLSDTVPFTAGCASKVIEEQVHKSKIEIASYFDLIARGKDYDIKTLNEAPLVSVD